MPYEEFHRLIGKAGLSIKEFAELLGMRPNSITNYNKVGFVPSHLAVIVSLISTMKDEGFDFYPILEKVQAYEKARIESQSKYKRLSWILWTIVDQRVLQSNGSL